jgi:outer membrane protein
MSRKTILAAILLLSAGHFAAAQSWTLRDCIAYALDSSITVRQQEITRQQQEINLNTAQNSRLPSLSGSTSENFSFGRSIGSDNTYRSSNSRSTALSLGLDVPVFQGLQIKNSIKRAQSSLAAADADLEKAREDLKISVAGSYVQVLYDLEIVDADRSQVEVDSLQLARLEEMLRNGKTSAVDVAQQRASLSQSRLALTQAENNLQNDKLALTQLLELPSPEGFSVVRPSEAELQPAALESPESVYLQAVQAKPSIKAEEYRLEANEYAVKTAKGALLPTISATGSIGSNFYHMNGSDYNESFKDQMKNNFSQGVGVMLSVPIFSRFQTRNQIRSAELDCTNQKLQIESVKKSLYKDIQTAYYNAVAAQSKLRSSEEAETSAEESFKLTQAKYENGLANITEFNEARNNYFKAVADLAQARYECLYQTAVLNFYKGEEIDF